VIVVLPTPKGSNLKAQGRERSERTLGNLAHNKFNQP
jgi:hypothetical protein